MEKFLIILFLVSSSAKADPLRAVPCTDSEANPIALRFCWEIHVSGSVTNTLIYGNSKYGYFEQKNFRKEKGEVVFEINPPGYVFPLDFYRKTGALIGNLTFPKPKSDILNPVKFNLVKGELSSNFEMFSVSIGDAERQEEDSLPSKNPELQLQNGLAVSINKFGELVWAFFPGPSAGPLSFKILGHGKYAMNNRPYLSIVDSRGDFLDKVNPRLADPSHEIHHDLLAVSENQFLVLSHHNEPLGKSFRNVASERKDDLYRVDTIEKLDLSDGMWAQVWNLFNHFSPVPRLGWYDAQNETSPDADGVRSLGQITSLSKYQDLGYLISLRRMNRLVLLAPDFKSVVWTVGLSEKDTFRPQTAADSFYHQSEATMVDDHHLLIFDTGKKNSRGVLLELDPTSQKFHVQRSFGDSLRLQSVRRGSAYFLSEANRAVVLFTQDNSSGDTLAEFDYGTGLLQAELKIICLRQCHGDRATPAYVLGTETYLGEKPPLLEASGKR